jgi:hypothetical protein
MKRHPRSFWEKVVAEVEAGSPAAIVAKHHGVKCGTLKWWKYQLRAQATPRSQETTFLPVVVHGEQESEGKTIEVLVRDMIVRVATGTDPGYVATLVGALREC